MADSPEKDELIQYTDVSKIVPGNNDRKEFDKYELIQLANSIFKIGLLQPIVVRKISNGLFEIVCGERRFRAMRDILDWDEVPCVIRDLDESVASSGMLAENVGRVPLSPLEESDAYFYRKTELGMSVAQIAEEAAVPASRVRDRLLLQKLVDSARLLVESKNMSIGFAKSLVRLDQNRQHFCVLVFRDRPGMRKTEWESLIEKRWEEQGKEDQLRMFDEVEKAVKLIDSRASIPIRGPQAITGIECDWKTILPDSPSKGGNASRLFIEYIGHLRAEGQSDAAGAVANVYNELVALNFIYARHKDAQKETKSFVGEELSNARKRKSLIDSIRNNSGF